MLLWGYTEVSETAGQEKTRGLVSSAASTVCETFHMQWEGNTAAAAAEESRPGLAAVAWRDNPHSKPGLTEHLLPQGFPLWPYCQQLCQRGARKERRKRRFRERRLWSGNDDRAIKRWFRDVIVIQLKKKKQTLAALLIWKFIMIIKEA